MQAERSKTFEVKSLVKRFGDEAALDALSLHPILTDVTMMAGFGIALLVPAIWLFGKQD